MCDLEPNRESSTYELTMQAANGNPESLKILETMAVAGEKMDFSSQNWTHVKQLLEQATIAKMIELTKSLVCATAPFPAPNFFNEEVLTSISVTSLKHCWNIVTLMLMLSISVGYLC